MVEIDVEYQGGLRCRATHGPSQNQLLTDAPVDNHGKGEAFSPTDLAATALGTCMITVIGIVGEKRGVELGGLKCHVTKIMSEDLPRRISKLIIKIDMPLVLGDPNGAILEKAALSCPVKLSLHPDIDCEPEFRYRSAG